MDEEFKIHYDQEAVRKKTENSIRKESYEKGLVQGIEQGIEQKNMEIVKNMLKKNIDIKTISECTGLPVEDINNLK